ncbi:MAG: methyltransferase domain-containing protein, partial [Myxococcota bacterium]
MFGSFVSATHDVADMKGCPVVDPGLTQTLETLRVGLSSAPVHGPRNPGLRYVVARRSRATGESLVTLVTSGDPHELEIPALGPTVGVWTLRNDTEGNRILVGSPEHVSGPRTIEERLAGHAHPIGPTSFFQVNPLAAERLFAIALEAAGEGERCVEGYCGVGVLTLPLKDQFARVLANEINPESTAILEKRAPSVEVHTGSAEHMLPPLLDEPADAVVLDPPRKGLGPRVAQAIANTRAGRIVLLSCEPKSLI